MTTRSSFIIVLGLALGCSSSSSSSGSALLTSLSAAQLGPLCDAQAAKVGGYGNQKTISCPGGQKAYISVPWGNQTTCISETQKLTACEATVDDVNQCLATGWPLLCSNVLPSACAVFGAPACQPGMTGGAPK